MTEGIDVSHYQGSIDWSKVDGDGKKFSFIKASEGFSWKDSRFKSNWKKAKSAGVEVGAYHFFRTKDGKRQAQNLLRRLDEVGFGSGDLLPVIDLETWDPDAGSSSTYIAQFEDWLDYVESKIGKKPIIYTIKSFWRRIGDPDHFGDYPLWCVDLSSKTNPRLPEGWNDFDLNQYSHSGSVSGISGDVDLNYAKTSLADLRL